MFMRLTFGLWGDLGDSQGEEIVFEAGGLNLVVSVPPTRGKQFEQFVSGVWGEYSDGANPIPDSGPVKVLDAGQFSPSDLLCRPYNPSQSIPVLFGGQKGQW